MLKQLNILITGGGSPGIIGTIYSLRNNFENRKVRIITTDVNTNVIGKYYSDQFYKIPHSTDIDAYLNKIFEVCEKEHIDVFIPQNTLELLVVSKFKDDFEKRGTRVVISSYPSIVEANNKLKTILKAQDIGLPIAKFELASDKKGLKKAVVNLGWPEKKVVVKPLVSNGSRGMRIISEIIDKKQMFFNEKPNSVNITFSELEDVLGDFFPELIVSEYLAGEEYSVDVFRTLKNTVIIPRRRDRIFAGITFEGTTIKHEDIILQSKKLAEALGLTFCFGFQFKLDKENIPKILECNPRVQGSMIMSTNSGANIIYLGVKEVLDEKYELPEINWDTKFMRYWGGVGLFNDQINLKL